MKTKIKNIGHALQIAAAMLLSLPLACTVETIVEVRPENRGDQAVQFSSKMATPQTKVGGANGDQWNGGDAIGVFMVKDATELTADNIVDAAQNIKYEAESDGANVPFKNVMGDTIFYPLNGKVNFFAYYPFTAALSADFKYAVNIKTQDDQDQLDLLYTHQKEPKGTGDKAELNFKHQLVKLVFHIQDGQDSIGSLQNGLTLDLIGLKTRASFALADSSLTIEATSDTTIRTFMTKNTNHYLAEAIVLPTADITADNVQVHFIANGHEEFLENLPPVGSGGNKVALVKGNRYTYTVKLNRNSSNPTDIVGEIDDWNDVPPADTTSDMATSIRILGGTGGSYTADIEVRYADAAAKWVKYSNMNGTYLVPYSGQATKVIHSIRLNGSTEIPIGRREGMRIEVNLNASNQIALRPAEADGFIPIGTFAEMKLMQASASSLAGKYRQDAEIDLKGQTFTPIGNATTKFTGEYDGNQYVIRNLSLTSTGANVGLFGNISAAKLSNIRLLASTINGQSSVGAICGFAQAGSTFTNCHAAAAVTATANNAGGICGLATSGTTTFSNCSFSGSATADAYAAGILAHLSASTTVSILTSRNTAAIHTLNGGFAGGICGANEASASLLTLTACYNTGSIDAGAANNAGGIAGMMQGTSAILGCYNTGSVSGGAAENRGLICGLNTGASVTQSFWTRNGGNAEDGTGTSSTGTNTTSEFSDTAWPDPTEAVWGTTNWKDLGGWNAGSPTYPRLHWE
jgi:hypothetical protein